MAAANSSETEPQAASRSVPLQRHGKIGGATREKAARRRKQRREEATIDENRAHDRLAVPTVHKSPFPVMKNFRQFSRRPIKGDLSRSSLRHNHIIQVTGQPLPVTAKKFSETALDTIADNRLAYFGADGDAEPVLSGVIGFAEDHKMGSVDSLGSSRQAQKLRASGKAGPLGKFFPTLRHL
jgi:hypothetical protein